MGKIKISRGTAYRDIQKKSDIKDVFKTAGAMQAYSDESLLNVALNMGYVKGYNQAIIDLVNDKKS